MLSKFITNHFKNVFNTKILLVYNLFRKRIPLFDNSIKNWLQKKKITLD